MRLWCILFVLLCTLCIGQEPKLDFVVKEKPDHLLVTQSGEFLIELKNVGSGTALGVEVGAEEQFVSLSAPKIASLGEGGSVSLKAVVSASQLAEGENAFTLKASWRKGTGERVSVTEKVKFDVIKPKVRIEKVESGLLPGKIRIQKGEKKTISVTVKNNEKVRLGDFSMVFFSKYPHFAISREGVTEVKDDGRKFVYAVEEYFSPQDTASKSFEFSCALPEGATSASFTLKVMLYWNGYLLDTVEIEVAVSGPSNGTYIAE
jgi:hypothetical protein